MYILKQKKIIFFSIIAINVAIVLLLLYQTTSNNFYFALIIPAHISSLIYFLRSTLVFQKTTTFMIGYYTSKDYSKHFMFIRSLDIDSRASDDQILDSFIGLCKEIHMKNDSEEVEPLVVSIQKINSYHRLTFR